jgi:Spy/CpxP family protein refolding chaperone
MAAMQQSHAQMKQIHEQARLQMLSALSPAHRALLANVVGQLAISPNPDRAAAAAALDRALTQTEGRTILAAEANERTQTQALMEAQRAQFEASLTPAQRAAMSERFAGRPHVLGAQRVETADPGRTLLDLALGHGERNAMFMMHAGGPLPATLPPPPQ